MIEKIRRYLAKYSMRGLLCLILSPFLMPWFAGCGVIKSFTNSIQILFIGNWSHYSGNSLHNALNNLFYYIQDLNIQRFGRFSDNALLGGTGHFSLSGLFHLTPLSLRLQASLGTCLLMFFSSLVYLAGMALWLPESESTFFALTVLGLVLTSSLFYNNFVDMQNYNVVAWAIFPWILYTLTKGIVIPFAVLSLFVAMSSFTGFLVLGCFVLAFSLYTLSGLPLIAMLPAALIWVWPIWRNLFWRGFSIQSLQQTAGLLGLHKMVKYIRAGDLHLSIPKLYIIVTRVLFIALLFNMRGLDWVTLLIIVVFSLWFLNNLVARFADLPTDDILWLTVSTIAVMGIMLTEMDSLQLIGLGLAWLLTINPPYLFLEQTLSLESCPGLPSTPKAWNISEILSRLDCLFEQVPSGSRILMAFGNPQGYYHQLFGGFRVIIEPISYVAQKHNILFFPDWYTVLDNNTPESAEDYWIRGDTEASKVMKKYGAEFLLSYHSDTTQWEPDHAAFSLVCSVNMDDVGRELWGKPFTLSLYRLEFHPALA